MTTPMERPDPAMPPGAGSPGMPPGSGAPGPSPYAVPAALSGLGVAALVLGVVGLVLAIVPFLFWLGGMLGVVALVLGIVGLSRAEWGNGRGPAVAGVALGAVTIFVSAAWLVALFVIVRANDATGDPVLEGETVSGAPETPGAETLPEPTGTAPAVLAFGETRTYEDGVQVTVSEPVPYRPDAFAAGYEKGDTAVRVTITIVNGSGKAIDVTTALPDARDAEGEQVSTIFDGSRGTEMFRGKVLPGKQARAGYAFALPADADGEVQLELAPQLLEYEPAIWTGSVK
ncbi:DUF4190 domain-containing protein [Streptomyces sp. NPDC015661]|uniref:DUF4190 domain-containing protein n=1 Tax=Streptomyces sp. NPDC015661 TaxID=3364961 RepID=UPI0036FF430A